MEAAVSMAGTGDREADVRTGREATDEALVEAFQRGDETAFDGLFLKYQDYVFSLCLGLLGDEGDARDATQETFLRVYQGLRRFRGEAAFTTWLYRIALHAARQLDHRRRRRQTLPLEAARGAVDPPSDLLDRRLTQIVRAERIQAVFGELSADHRTALVLRYYRDLSYEEMAEVLQTSVSAVKARLHRARKAFYQVYVGMFGEEEM
jgi:RNA polymerase sigma-70 factor (ECF subfamily)